MKTHAIAHLVTIVLLSVGLSLNAAAADKRPNVLLIVADDMGFSDVGSYGSEIPTPHLNTLATEGVSFTNFHMSPVCSVSRSMFLTGVDAHRIGLGSFADSPYKPYLGKPGYEGYLTQRAVTIAELLRDADYHTYMTGKWHLGHEDDQSPHARGFEESYTLLEAAGNHYDQKGFLFSQPVATYRENGKKVQRPDGIYSSDLWTQKILSMIDKHHGDGKPFFAYVAYTAPHWPIQAPQEDIKKFLGKYDMGWEALRQQRFARMTEQGLITPGNETLPPINPLIPKWDSLTPEQKKYWSKRFAVYAAMVSNLDRHIGELIDHLKKTGEYDNTVIIFASDNGAEPTMVDGRFSNPEESRWIHLYFDNSYENLGKASSCETIGTPWAAAGVTPLSWWKGFVSEGGTRVPFIIRMPGAQAGTRTDAVAHHIDLAATILDVTGVKHPGTRYDGREVEAVAGKSLVPLVSGQADRVHSPEQPIGFELFGTRALIQAHWKIINITTAMGGDCQWHLYDLSRDMAEQFPLDKEAPERYQAMIAAYAQWAKENNVLPMPCDWNPYSSLGQ